MSAVVFSLLHASRGRPAKAVAAMQDALAKAANPEAVEYVVAADTEDRETIATFDRFATFIVFGSYGGSAPAWSAAAKVAHGEWLLQISDDLFLPEKWDTLLLDAIGEAKGPTVIAVSDGHRRDSLMTCFICNRAYFELEGFISDAYKSVYSDGEATYRALLNVRHGRAQIINARHIIFDHQHHWHSPKTVPWDETYAVGNSPERYSDGRQLFETRNPDWLRSGLVDWL